MAAKMGRDDCFWGSWCSGDVGGGGRALEGLRGDELVIAEGMLEQAVEDARLEPRGPGDYELLNIKIPEGFAFYNLRLGQYREAARRFALESGARGEVLVIGVRSIGTSLSRVVAEALGARRCTVRLLRKTGLLLREFLL